MDLDSQLGRTSDGGRAPDSCIGEFNCGVQTVVGDGCVSFLEEQAMCSVGTFSSEGGPSFFSHTGSSSTMDHLFVPQAILASARRGRRAWAQGRRLQLIPDGRRRDHLPLVAELHLPKFVMTPEDLTKGGRRFDQEAIALALQTGEGRQAFL